MKHIVALCIKPSIDISTGVETVVAGPKLRCEAPRRDPGGGGINICRAVTKLGGKALVLYPEGGDSGRLLRDLLEKEGVDQKSVPIEAMIPESLMVLEKSSGKQYRFNVPGAELKKDEWRRFLDVLAGLTPKPDFVAASGGLPPGVPEDFYARAAGLFSGSDVKFILDTHGPPLIKAAKENIFLIKANMKEFQDIAGQKVKDETKLRELANKKILGKKSDILVISLGAAGAVLVSPEGTERFCAPVVPIHSRIGAGDSMVAGIVLKLAQGESLRNAVRFGIAAGSAAVMTPGTELCRREDAERLYEQIVEER